METIYLSLGSNLGDRQNYLEQAVKRLSELGKITKKSSLQETEPWGKTDQPKFLNMVLAMETELEPLEFLDAIQQIEHDLGRVRTEKWGPRTIDLDILLWGKRKIHHPRLTVPHTEIMRREFLLELLHQLSSQEKRFL